MADNPFLISRAALFEAVKNDRVARAIEKLLQIASANQIAEVLLAALNEAYPAGRVVMAGTGLIIDTSVPGELTIKIDDNPFEIEDLVVNDDATINGELDVVGDTSVGGELVVVGQASAGSLALGGTASPFIGVPDFSLPVTIGGDTYYLALSSTP